MNKKSRKSQKRRRGEKMPKLVLKSIEEEAADCRKAFEGVEVGALAFHCHHEILLERLSEIPENRITYILSYKSGNEQALRLRLFRPIPKELIERDAKWQEAYAKRQEADAKWQEAYAKWQEAYAKWQEAYAKRQEADAKWQEAYAKRQEADAKWQEADAKRQEADAKWQEAYAKLGTMIHFDVCKNCPWDGKTIFV